MCGKNNWIYDRERGSVVCRHCGYERRNRQIDPEMSQKTDLNETKIKNHSGDFHTNTSLYMEYDTYIDCKNASPKWQRLIRWDKRREYVIKSLLTAIVQINRVGSLLSIPLYIRDAGIALYRKVWNMGLVKGGNALHISIVCLFFACLMHHSVRTLNDLIKASGFDSAATWREYFRIRAKIPTQLPVQQLDGRIFVMINEIFPKLNYDMQNKMQKIIQMIIRGCKIAYGDRGTKPTGVICGALFVTSKYLNIKITQKKIRDIFRLSDNTLRFRIRDAQVVLENLIANSKIKFIG